MNNYYIKSLEVDYDPFFKTINEKHITQTNLIRRYSFSSSLFSRMKHHDNIEMNTILELMKAIGETDINNILKIVVVE